MDLVFNQSCNVEEDGCNYKLPFGKTIFVMVSTHHQIASGQLALRLNGFLAHASCHVNFKGAILWQMLLNSLHCRFRNCCQLGCRSMDTVIVVLHSNALAVTC